MSEPSAWREAKLHGLTSTFALRAWWTTFAWPTDAHAPLASVSEGWYRYGDSNPGSKVENLVS